jgi:uncharacterized membrane protein YiaA
MPFTPTLGVYHAAHVVAGKGFFLAELFMGATFITWYLHL